MRYDVIGRTYTATRATDPRIAAAIWEALGDARTVVNVGAGTGNYEPPDREVTAVEPSAVMIAQRPPDAARVVQGTAEALPFEDDSFDTVVSTLVLCTVDDPGRTIDEIARVLRPGGTLLFLEHVRADSPRLARWQDRLHRPWHAFAAGCHANRATVALLGESPLEVVDVEKDTWSWMPALVHPLATGRARA